MPGRISSPSSRPRRSMSKCASPIPCAVCVGFSRSCAATACAKRSRFLAILGVSAITARKGSAGVARGAGRWAVARWDRVGVACRLAHGERGAHPWGYLRRKQLGRTQRLLVRQHADADVAEEAVVMEQLVVGQDLARHFLGGADEQVALWRAAGIELGTAHRRPATLATDAIHHLRIRSEELVGRALGVLGYVHVRVDPNRRAALADRGLSLGRAVVRRRVDIVASSSLLLAAAQRLTVQLYKR